MTMLTIGDAPLTLAQLRAVLDGPVMVTITPPRLGRCGKGRGDRGGDRG